MGEARWMGVDEESCELEVLAGTQVTTPLTPDNRMGWAVTFRLVGCRAHQVAVPSIRLTAWLPAGNGHVLERSIGIPWELFEIMKEGGQA